MLLHTPTPIRRASSRRAAVQLYARHAANAVHARLRAMSVGDDPGSEKALNVARWYANRSF